MLCIPSILQAFAHLPLVPHICVSELDQHWFNQWPEACSVPLHEPMLTCKWTMRKKLEIRIEIQICSLMKLHLKKSSVNWFATILSRERWVNDVGLYRCPHFYIICKIPSRRDSLTWQSSRNLAFRWFNKLKSDKILICSTASPLPLGGKTSFTK